MTIKYSNMQPKIHKNKPFHFFRGKLRLFLASLSNFLIHLLTNLQIVLDAHSKGFYAIPI